jgi:hypothetical protein
MRFINPTWWRSVAGPSKLLGPIICLSLLTIATAVYLSPTGSSIRPDAANAAGTPAPSSSADASASSSSAETSASTSSTPSSAASSSKAAKPSASKSAAPKPSEKKSGSSGEPYHYTPPVTVTVSAPAPTPTTVTQTKYAMIHTTTTKVDVVHSTSVETVPAKTKQLYCSDFRYQQDAQAAYVANLSDPWGLDGAPGPYNGDGLACTQLPKDPNRAASIPVAAYIPPAPADKTQLVDPSLDYYGLAEDGLPGDSGLYNSLATTAGKAPSSLEWFDYWSEGYDVTNVKKSWAVGALPIITWMSESDQSSDPNAASYTLQNIVNGTFDSYLYGYASDVVRAGLPVAIRFDQEMNGNWFSWSAGMAANQAGGGAPNYYVQAWRHIWNIFNAVHANDFVIWLWAPSRTDTIQPHVATSGLKYETSLAEDYPGSQYVDWVGVDAYQYKPSDGWTYNATFAQTVAGLKSVAPGKGIYIAETGATETVGATDYAVQKAAWTTDSLTSFAADNAIVGFTWFNNQVNGVHKVDGQVIQTDWQFTTSPQSLAAFKAGIANPKYASGVIPDGTGA